MILRYERDLRKEIDAAKAIMKNALDEYKTKCANADTSYAKWCKERKKAEAMFEEDISDLPRRLRKLVQDAIAAKKGGRLTPGCDYDKYNYFLEQMWMLDLNRKQLRYNPNYAKQIAEEFAVEYLRLLKQLDNDEPTKKGDKATWKSDGMKKVENAFNDLCFDHLYDLSVNEMEAIEDDILNEVGLTKGAF